MVLVAVYVLMRLPLHPYYVKWESFECFAILLYPGDCGFTTLGGGLIFANYLASGDGVDLHVSLLRLDGMCSLFSLNPPGLHGTGLTGTSLRRAAGLPVAGAACQAHCLCF